MPRKPEIARNVVVLPAPLVPRIADDLLRADRQSDALHRGDHALVDDLDLVDLRAGLAHLRAPASGRYLKGQSRK